MSRPEDERVPISLYSIRRKSTQINFSILLVILLTILFIVLSNSSFTGVEEALRNDLDEQRQEETGIAAVAIDSLERTQQAISNGRTQLLAIGILCAAAILFVAFRSITVGLRAVALEVWIRRMGEGDLDYKVDMKGQDEIVELSKALEALRQRSIKALQLDLVEKLSRGLQDKNEELERVLLELRQTQEQIILRRKLVELGGLTAGVAHEIRNPLNFMKNFSEASEELLEELRETLAENADDLSDDMRRAIAEISQELTKNVERIRSHGDRADRIVHDMLMIGRGGGSVQTVNINDLLRDRAMLAYHSARANDQDFVLDIKLDLDPDAGEVVVVPEDMGRVFLNMVGNSCYAVEEKSRTLSGDGDAYTPRLWLKTERKGNEVEVMIRDNGTGIHPDAMEKIFNPFFTTKPAGTGTGLGLSLSNDIVRGYGGSITPASECGEYTEMIVSIPVSGREEPAGE